MRGFIISVLICWFFFQAPANAFLFGKKDYKQMMLNDAVNAEKRNNHKQAFHSYEKAIYYYKKDKEVLESYAQFCERNKYFDKAEKLYSKLYVMTKNEKYLFKSRFSAIKNGVLSDEKLQEFVKDKKMTKEEKTELNAALVYHFAYKQEWKKVQNTCDKIPKKFIGKDLITTCIAATERNKDNQNSLKYYLRFLELYPEDSRVTNKIINLSKEFKNLALEEEHIKKLIIQNPDDLGIRYQLAGFYERQGNWKRAAKIYEGLMILGDKNQHVKDSYAYVMSRLHPEIIPEPTYLPKPLKGFKLYEKNFYEAWNVKNYPRAMSFLEKMLKEKPKNKKLLRHKVDILAEQEKYSEAISAFQKLQTVKKFSIEDAKFLAFLYSKTENLSKALEVIENALNKKSKNKELLNLALEYSLADNNWDKAIVYNDKLIKFDPKSEKLLKTGGDLYSIKKDFVNSAKYYEKLVKYYPKTEYKVDLANIYMAGGAFEKAEKILEPMYYKDPEDSKVVDLYLDSLLAQQKTYNAYWVIRERNLYDTEKGYIILGDLNLKNKKYSKAANYYFNALRKKPKNEAVRNNLAFCYRMLEHRKAASKLYKYVLKQNPENLEAKVGLGSLEIDKKNFKYARKIFNSILKENPDYRPAKMAIAHSYIANDEKLSALNILNSVTPDNESKMLKAEIYYDFDMPVDSENVLKTLHTKEAEKLKADIKRDNAITITPNYSLFVQQLAEAFNLDSQSYGISVSENTKNNTKAGLDYKIYWYTSGAPYFLSNVTNEIKFGAQGRPNTKWAYKANIGGKFFQFGNGNMLITDSWLKYYFNDKFNLTAGFKRDNLEQSYVSAVGEFIDGRFTGRVAENKFYLSFNAQLPKQFYSFGRIAYGIMNAQNLETNQYTEAMVGAGRRIYDNPKNKWIQTVNLDIVTYNIAYQYDLLNLYNSAGVLFGGYFSPSYFNATTANLKFEGKIKKWGLRYGFEGFAGPQFSQNPQFTKLSWGFAPYLAYDLGDHITIDGSYHYYNYADIQRHYFMVSVIIRGFKKYVKK